MLHQVSDRSSGSDGQNKASLREDLQEFLSREAPLHQLDDLTKVNSVTLETVLRCLHARYMADMFYTNAGCTLVALNPFKLVPQLYTPELMREYHSAPQPEKLKPHIFTVAEQTYRNVKSLIDPVNQSIVVSGESGAGKTWTSRCLMKFYAVVAAAPTSWESPKIAERIEQRILNSNPVMEAFEDCFEVTREAMMHLGIDIPTQNNIFKVLAGLLHLGNVRFADSEDEAHPCQLMDSAKCFVRTSASLLGLHEDTLLETVQIRTIRAGRQQQVFRKPCSRGECDTRRDCLAKVVYARLFDWLVSVINSSICADPDSWTAFIGLLDVYGFESFPDNSLEQLCINYANEKLQQHFVAHYLRAQQEEYALEGLEWSFVNYQDNQTCLDLIEGSPISICSLLNEECRLNRPSSAAQLQVRIESALADSPCLGHNRLSQEPSFIVVHYAGPVRYLTAGLVEKNKDPVPPELTELLQLSHDPLLTVLFPTQPKEKTQEEPSGQSRAPVLTVVSKFKASLEQLLLVLHSTTPHYIRCIKPNSQGQPQTFFQEEVVSQLEACGLVETIHISAAGFPIRVSHQNFLERYALLRRLGPHMPSGLRSPHATRGYSGQLARTEEATLQTVLRDLLHALPALTQVAATPADPLHCGKTKVFMTESVLELLEGKRARVLEQCARCIQYGWKRHQHRKQERQRRAATLIQAAIRSWLTRKHIQRLHTAASVIKRAWHKWRVRMACLASKELDGIEEKSMSQFPSSLNSSLLPSAQTRLQGAIIRLWPLGLVLANAAVGLRGFQRKLVVCACLQLPSDNLSTCKVQTAQGQTGVVSIRALPQGSIKFHCRKSPLRYADICPEPSPYSITGFNQILLERHSPVHL
ncbi:unconventional myosin-XIX isoform X3 [Cavia porcellus]|uniref:unconventional myosin-XIX isoform X3 n=1 Tax=Cavia porcellus TaxID=10141 RepID=UPI002FE20E56